MNHDYYPDTRDETRLRERAEHDGQDVSTMADAMLADALASDPDDLTDDEIAQIRVGIRRSLLDCGVGRVKPVGEWAAEIRRTYDLLPPTT